MHTYWKLTIASLLLAPSLAWAACTGPLTPQTLRTPFDGQGILLGLNGERIAARGDLIFVAQDGDLQPQQWLDQVDWSVYTTSQSGPTVLQRDADGHICRIDMFSLVRGRIVQDRHYQLSYDAQGRLSSATRYGANDYVENEACLNRDAQGAITAVYTKNCASQPANPVYYVRDDGGKLLRIIDARAGMAGTAVQVFNADGGTTRYRPKLNPNGEMVVAAEAGSSEERTMAVEAGKSPHIPTEIPGIPWHVVRVPADTLEGDGLPSWAPEVQTRLMEGVSDKEGIIELTPQQTALFHQALQETPGRVFFYVQAMTRYLPVVAMPPERWQHCTDPAQRAAKACG